MDSAKQKDVELVMSAFMKSWELYIQFYTYFLGFNVAGLTLVAKYLAGTPAKAPVVVAFLVQNIITAISSYGMAALSTETANKLTRLGVPPETSPIPKWMGQWGGMANAVACTLMMLCWVMLFWIRKSVSGQD